MEGLLWGGGIGHTGRGMVVELEERCRPSLNCP
jgi:hypothetical protein